MNSSVVPAKAGTHTPGIFDSRTVCDGLRGCFTVMTAASEAVFDKDIRALVLDGFSELDRAFTACFRLAKEKGEMAPSTDPVVLAQLGSATIHTIAIRARARVPRKELEAIVKGAIAVMCAAPPHQSGR